MACCGVVFLDKPVGWSSRRAVDEVARCFRDGGPPPKAGHTGTLDPLAGGMLPVLLGAATRFASLGLEADKRYRLTVDLSFQTTTLDAEGEVILRSDRWRSLDEAAIAGAIEALTGTIEQIPPHFSAVRVGGRRSHALARAGRAKELPPRRVVIHAITLRRLRLPELELEVCCGKGAYMRALARDLGARLGCGGCVTALRRLSTGGWPPELMVGIEQLRRDPAAALHPVEFWLRHLPEVLLDGRNAARFVEGQRIALAGLPVGGLVRVCCGGRCLGTARVAPGRRAEGWPVLHPDRVLPRAVTGISPGDV